MSTEGRVKGERRRRRWALGLLLLYALILGAITDKRIVPAGALLSRLALVESLAVRGTFAIDGSRFSRTVDRVRMGDHDYCDKLPLLPVATAGIYAILHHGLGITFEETPGIAIFILTYLTMGGATLWLAALFHREVLRAKVGSGHALWITSALALATLIFTYGGTYQNHTVSAAFLFAGFVWLRAAREGSRNAALICGVWVGLAAASEMPTGFAFAGVFAVALGAVGSGRQERTLRVASFLGGFGIPILLTSACLWIAWGDPRPAYLIPGAYDYPGSAFEGRAAGLIQSTRIPGDVGVYAFHNLLGIRGLLSTTPILLAGLVGLVALLLRAGDPRRWEGWVIGAGSAIVIAFYSVATDSYGGWAYGLRFFLPLAPLLLYLAVHLPERLWSRGPGIALAALLVVSAALSWIGAYHPWTPCYQGETIHYQYAGDVRWPPAGNLAAMSEEWLPGSGIATWMRRTLIDPEDGTSYLYLAVSFDSQGKVAERDRILRGGR